MDVLRIETDDLTLTVVANGVDVAYDRSKRKQKDRIATCTSYSWTAKAPKADLFHGEDRSMRPMLGGSPAPPVFFENKDYVFEVDLKAKGRTAPYVNSRLKEIKESFIYRQEPNFLVGMLNFGNELGKSDLVVRYERDGDQREFRFEFEVLSTKLDQKGDLQCIMADIEREYPLLVLDVMRKTYANFKSGGEARSDLVWWQVFAGIYEEFIRSARFILNKPHSRLIAQEQWERADRLKRTTPRLEEDLSRWRKQTDHRYRTEHRSLSLDTPENRFFKYATAHVGRRFEFIKHRILKQHGNALTQEYHNELQTVTKDLGSIRSHPMFRSVGAFAGLRQESTVLQRATGYSAVYKNWIMLQRGISFLEDMQRLETKNVADLYQIWCFLEMKNIVNEVLGRKNPDQVELGLVQEQGLVLQLAQGKGSRLGYDLENDEVLELFHEFSIKHISSSGLTTYTGKQSPDIALRIRKNDLKENYVLTYLFDAKYRLESDDREDGAEGPPPDALNQMHRYRDAIFFLDRKQNAAQPEKEVIGGYVLFPGEGTTEQIQKSDHYKAIAQVNIGAFPLRPGDTQQRHLLKKHIQSIIQGPTANLLSDVRPQKRMSYRTLDAEVIIGSVRPKDQALYLANGGEFYHFGPQRPARFGSERLRYFAPFIAGKGVAHYYDVEEYLLLPRNGIYPKGHSLHKVNDDGQRLVLRLGKRYSIKNGRSFKLNGKLLPFRYTLLSMLRAPKDGKIELIKSAELQGW